MSVGPLEHDQCHKLFAEAAGAISILTNLNKGDKFVEGKEIALRLSLKLQQMQKLAPGIKISEWGIGQPNYGNFKFNTKNAITVLTDTANSPPPSPMFRKQQQ